MLLDAVHSPADLKKFSPGQLKELAGEIREFMIASVAETGGHLASSLGAVELTLALHFVYQTPRDLIVWDVGHQTYAHKIITGRREVFRTLRQTGGISGFPKREESAYDTFNTGHSSTSISAALGMARAAGLNGGKERVVAVIGDGSLSNGLALEALNDAGHKKTDLLVILNDNRMSISPAVGGLSNYLNQIITGHIYNRLKERVEALLASIPAVGKWALKFTVYLEEITKGLVVPGVLFEELGFRYFGPVNGHDLDQLLPTLERIHSLPGPILLHVLTRKGKGFEHAEKDPVAFHGISKFDPRTGQASPASEPTYSQACAQSLLRQARSDRRVVAIVAAMTSGTSMDEFARELPERFFDVGIAEGHAVTLAAGMAARGLRPVVLIYSTFLQRAYDQILHDVCLQNLPVVFGLDRAGLVGEDGPTHHGIFDLAYLRPIPNLVIFAPSDGTELAGMLKTALARTGPTAIRYPRGRISGAELDLSGPAVPVGSSRITRQGRDVAVFALGTLRSAAEQASELLAREGLRVTVVDVRCVKPLDEELLCRVAQAHGAVLTAEEHVLAGGFGSAVLEMFQRRGLAGVHLDRAGFPDQFVDQGSRPALLAQYDLDAEGLARRLRGLEREKTLRP